MNRIDEINISSNDYSMFIRGVDEKEILDMLIIVRINIPQMVMILTCR